VFLGAPEHENIPAYRLDRPGLSPPVDAEVPGMGPTPVRIRRQSTDAPLFRPRTLLLGDSFTQGARAKVAPYFADLTLLQSQAAPHAVARAMVSADVVVVEIVERSLNGGSALLESSNLDLIARTLAAHPRR
jgi:hypothetical protein